MINEAAAAAKADPIQFRIDYISEQRLIRPRRMPLTPAFVTTPLKG